MTDSVGASSFRDPSKIITNFSEKVKPMEQELERLMALGSGMQTSDMLKVQQLLNQISQLTGLAAADLSKYFDASDKVINKL